jgi:hypothetical protein
LKLSTWHDWHEKISVTSLREIVPFWLVIWDEEIGTKFDQIIS